MKVFYNDLISLDNFGFLIKYLLTFSSNQKRAWSLNKYNMNEGTLGQYCNIFGSQTLNSGSFVPL